MERSQLSIEYILILTGIILIVIAIGITIKMSLHEETPYIHITGSKIFSGTKIKHR